MAGDNLVMVERFAVMAVDPGGTTGLAAGMFRRSEGVDGTVLGPTLRRAVRRRAVWTQLVTGSPEEQAWFIARGWTEFLFRWNVELGQPVRDCHLVVEEFELRQMAVQLSPVEVTAGLKTLLMPAAVEIERQSASQAMSKATNARLRQWDLYALGRGRGDHKRDALRHLALRVSRVLG